MSSLTIPLLSEDETLRRRSNDTRDQDISTETNSYSDSHSNDATKSTRIGPTWKSLFGLVAIYLSFFILFLNTIFVVYLDLFKSHCLATILIVLSTFLPVRLYLLWRDTNGNIFEDLEKEYKREYIDKFDLEANEEKVRRQNLVIRKGLAVEASLRLKLDVAVPINESTLKGSL